MINAVTGQFSRFVNFAQDRFDAERPWTRPWGQTPWAI